MERLSDGVIEHLILNGNKWVRQQREELRPLARELSAEERRLLGPFYGDLLDSLRVKAVRSIPIPPELQSLLPPDFVAFTFFDTIAAVREDMEVISHEAAHAAQFKVLGLEESVSSLVKQAAKVGFQYGRNPFEKQAQRMVTRLKNLGGGRGAFNAVEDIRQGLKVFLGN